MVIINTRLVLLLLPHLVCVTRTMTFKAKHSLGSSAAHPEQTGEPAVLRRIKQVQVVVEVALQRLLLFLVANASKQNRPARRTHRH